MDGAGRLARSLRSLRPQADLKAAAIGAVVLLRERQVLIACICDPGVGFSLVGRRRCQHNRELVRRAVLRAPL